MGILIIYCQAGDEDTEGQKMHILLPVATADHLGLE
jgi:hypothetical protein